MLRVDCLPGETKRLLDAISSFPAIGQFTLIGGIGATLPVQLFAQPNTSLVGRHSREGGNPPASKASAGSRLDPRLRAIGFTQFRATLSFWNQRNSASSPRRRGSRNSAIEWPKRLDSRLRGNDDRIGDLIPLP